MLDLLLAPYLVAKEGEWVSDISDTKCHQWCKYHSLRNSAIFWVLLFLCAGLCFMILSLLLFFAGLEIFLIIVDLLLLSCSFFKFSVLVFLFYFYFSASIFLILLANSAAYNCVPKGRNYGQTRDHVTM